MSQIISNSIPQDILFQIFDIMIIQSNIALQIQVHKNLYFSVSFILRHLNKYL